MIEGVDPFTISKKGMIELIIKKHHFYLDQYKSEIEKGTKEIVELGKRVKGLKKERDTLNKLVSGKKSIRNGILQSTKETKKEYFDLLKGKTLSNTDMKKMDMYKKQLMAVEWKLETEGIDLETEKRLMKEARHCYFGISEINNAIRENEEREQVIVTLVKDISENMRKNQDLHEEMVKLVEEADSFHDQWLNSRRKLRERTNEIERVKRWLSRHKEILEYWGKFLKEGEFKYGNIKRSGSGQEKKRKVTESSEKPFFLEKKAAPNNELTTRRSEISKEADTTETPKDHININTEKSNSLNEKKAASGTDKNSNVVIGEANKVEDMELVAPSPVESTKDMNEKTIGEEPPNNEEIDSGGNNGEKDLRNEKRA